MQNTSFRIRLCRNVWQRVALVLPLLLAGVCLFQACSNDDTSYADKRKRERRQVQNFLKKGAKVVDAESGLYLLDVPGNIKVISEEQFYKQDSTTNVAQNEYVLFAGSGVYMQIVRRGTGKVLGPNETASVLLKYTEVNMMTDSVISSNNIMRYSALVDVMKVKMISGSPFAQFESGVFMSTYRTPKVPNGLLAPLTYIRLGKLSAEGVAKVRLIVPSAQGTAVASGAVYPCLYELTYQRGR